MLNHQKERSISRDEVMRMVKEIAADNRHIRRQIQYCSSDFFRAKLREEYRRNLDTILTALERLNNTAEGGKSP